MELFFLRYVNVCFLNCVLICVVVVCVSPCCFHCTRLFVSIVIHVLLNSFALLCLRCFWCCAGFVLPRFVFCLNVCVCVSRSVFFAFRLR